jgi:hypothetical protein
MVPIIDSLSPLSLYFFYAFKSSSLFLVNSYNNYHSPVYLNGLLAMEVVEAPQLLVSVDHIASFG